MIPAFGYKTNSYIDKMFCIECNNCVQPNCRACQNCGKTLFGKNTVNVYTDKIPPLINYYYTNMIYPNKYPYIYYYGSYHNKLINYR